MIRTVLALLVAVLALGPLAASAAADPTAVIDDCQDGVLDERHARGDLRDAKAELQGDTAEYTNCAEVIDGALKSTSAAAGSGGAGGATGSAASAGGVGGGVGAGGSPPATPDDPAATVDSRGLRRDASGVPVDDRGRQVDPQTFAPEARPALDEARRGVNVAAAGVRPPDDPGTSLPAPLVVLLVALGLTALAAGATGLRRLRTAPPRRRPA
jgi:hypothetical protein